ncbi:MAG TPA: FIST N-terminal domain-containing protein, partial [Polyangiaceae bacterium]
MDYRSASTTIADPYRAGAELGDRLEHLKPDTVLIFCTIHYMDAIPDLVAGIRDILGTDVLLCGGTGDGIYETSGVASHGVSALGIRSDAKTQWKAVHVRGVRAD